MRDVDSLLNLLVNIDRHSLGRDSASEAEAAQRSVNSARQRTASQMPPDGAKSSRRLASRTAAFFARQAC
jgi:hypothetical protein